MAGLAVPFAKRCAVSACRCAREVGNGEQPASGQNAESASSGGRELVCRRCLLASAFCGCWGEVGEIFLGLGLGVGFSWGIAALDERKDDLGVLVRACAGGWQTRLSQ